MRAIADLEFVTIAVSKFSNFVIILIIIMVRNSFGTRNQSAVTGLHKVDFMFSLLTCAESYK